MIAELTNEQIVTKLLTSEEILKPVSITFDYPNTKYNLGEYLDNLPEEELYSEAEEIEIKSEEDLKYVFIQNKKSIF